MRNQIKNITYFILSVIALGFDIWHVVTWYSTGVYDGFPQMIEGGEGYLVVLYTLALMIVTGCIISLFMSFASRVIPRNGDKS